MQANITSAQFDVIIGVMQANITSTQLHIHPKKRRIYMPLRNFNAIFIIFIALSSHHTVLTVTKKKKKKKTS